MKENRFDLNKKDFPKVLVVGQTFNKTEGSGITLSNLFFDWPKEKLAVTVNTNICNEVDFSVCNNYFQLTYRDKLHPFPLGIPLPKIKGGPILNVNQKNRNFDLSEKKYRPRKFERIYKIIKFILDFFGLYHLLYRIEITEDFENWVKDFNPDIIYSPLNTLEMIRLVNDLSDITHKRVVIHMWDDWPQIINKHGLLYFYWKKTIEKEFRQLLDKSSILLSISESMSLEYKDRYKKNFIPFHNPIETSKWLKFSKKNWSRKGLFTILYAGRIGIGMQKSIIDFAKVVNDLSKENFDIVFEIQSSDISLIRNQVQFNEHVKWVRPVDYETLPKKFSEVDLLLIPVDFDTPSLRFIRLSYQTKISEYMISGTPVLVYADKSTEVARYVKEDGWGYWVSERDPEKLKEAVLTLYKDENLRMLLGEKAKNLAMEREDAEKIREKFRQCLSI